MRPQVFAPFEGSSAHSALVWLFSCVAPFVAFQVPSRTKWLLAETTLVSSIPLVVLLVRSEADNVFKIFATFPAELPDRHATWRLRLGRGLALFPLWWLLRQRRFKMGESSTLLAQLLGKRCHLEWKRRMSSQA